MFVYTIGDVLVFGIIILVAVFALGGYLLYVVMMFAAYICDGVIWIFNRVFRRKENT